jgi:hypothetical protein
MKILTKDEFNALTEYGQYTYINNLCECAGIDHYLAIHEYGAVIDVDSGEEATNLIDYALDLNIEATDLQGKVFAD